MDAYEEMLASQLGDEPPISPSELNAMLERVKSVIDRVLWTGGATEWNKRLLAEAIADELGNVIASERESCAAWYSKEGLLLDEDDVAEAMRKRSNA
jgi:hypothetical protein